MATIYAVVSPHSQIQIKTEMMSPQNAARTPTPNRPLRPVNKDGEPGKARRQLAMNLNKGGPVINNRRNARERNRVKQVNQGFAVLRAHLPAAQKNKKISKVDTLRGAIDYIQGLSELLAASERYEAASFSPAEPPPPPAELYASASAFHSPGYGLAAYPAAESAPLPPEPPSYSESVRGLQQRGAPARDAGQEELLSALRWWHGAGLHSQ